MKKQKSSSIPTPIEQQFPQRGLQVFQSETFQKSASPGCILNFSRLRGTHGFSASERWKRLDEKEIGEHMRLV